MQTDPLLSQPRGRGAGGCRPRGKLEKRGVNTECARSQKAGRGLQAFPDTSLSRALSARQPRGALPWEARRCRALGATATACDSRNEIPPTQRRGRARTSRQANPPKSGGAEGEKMPGSSAELSSTRAAASPLCPRSPAPCSTPTCLVEGLVELRTTQKLVTSTSLQPGHDAFQQKQQVPKLSHQASAALLFPPHPRVLGPAAKRSDVALGRTEGQQYLGSTCQKAENTASAGGKELERSVIPGGGGKKAMFKASSVT